MVIFNKSQIKRNDSKEVIPKKRFLPRAAAARAGTENQENAPIHPVLFSPCQQLDRQRSNAGVSSSPGSEKSGEKGKIPLDLLEFIGHFRGAGAEPCSEPAQTDIACEVFDLWQQRGQARTGGAAEQGLAAGTGALGQVHPDRCSVTLSLPARRGNPPRATGERGGIWDSARG